MHERLTDDEQVSSNSDNGVGHINFYNVMNTLSDYTLL